MRILGQHPIPKKNVVYFECSTRNKDNPAPHGYNSFTVDGIKMPSAEAGTYNINKVPKDGKCHICGEPVIIHQRKSRKIRLCAETLPGDKEEVSEDGTQTAETKNTIYPELKRWLPRFLIKRDITFRNMAMIIKDPLKGIAANGTVNQGNDIVVDFVSYAQSLQASAGVQRLSIYCDEEPPKEFWDEQIPRLLAEDGDLLLGLTPAQQMTWTYDELFERASVYFRTQHVVDYLNTVEKRKDYKRVMTTESSRSIGVMQSATDDNPTLGKAQIEQMFSNVDDPDVLATRRYGIHRQVSGRIFKYFDYRVHYRDFENYFPDGMLHSYNHYLMIDYHPHVKWAVMWIALSPQNEAFVYREWNPDPERLQTITMAKEIALMSGSYKMVCCLIDPRAEETQTNTGTTTVEDLNRYFYDYKQEGICTRHYWQTWDTKGTRGREVLRERIKNAVDCQVPFNNKVKVNGISRYVPTIWVSNRCSETARSFKKWRLEGRKRSYANVGKEISETPIQKWSHFCTAAEAIMKDKRFRPPLREVRSNRKPPEYFKGTGTF